jgi:hypothetical protein
MSKDYIFKRPTNVTGNNTLLVQFKEATGVTGIHSETAETIQTVDSLGRPLQLTTKRFAGEGTSGPLLSQENLFYSDRENGVRVQILTKSAAFLAFQHRWGRSLQSLRSVPAV